MRPKRHSGLISVQEYLALEETSEVRHEFVNGKIFAMSGATKSHNLIAANILTALKIRLKDKNCNVFISDVKVQVKSSNSFYYPDVFVECGTTDQSNLFSEAPKLIFEILSKSTASIDRREKRIAYQSIDSLQEYVIVHQTRKHLELYRREGENWTFDEITKDDTLCLKSCTELDLELPLREIYEGVDFNLVNHFHVQEDSEVYCW
jgi:Uma2 family endonuclease